MSDNNTKTNKMSWPVRAQIWLSAMLMPVLLRDDPKDVNGEPRLTVLGMLVAYCVVPFVIIGVLLRHPQRCWRMVTGKPDPKPKHSGFPNTDAEDVDP